MFTSHIDELLMLSVRDLKRLGLLSNKATYTNERGIHWTRNGQTLGGVHLTVSIQREYTSVIRLDYTADGQPRTQIIEMIWKPSNLGVGGYWLFKCPDTGRPCRKLYLHDGRFFSRYNVGLIYSTQAKSHHERETWVTNAIRFDKCLRTINEPRRKWYYRGRITPFGRKAEKAGNAAKIFYCRFETKLEQYANNPPRRGRPKKERQPEIKDIAVLLK